MCDEITIIFYSSPNIIKKHYKVEYKFILYFFIVYTLCKIYFIVAKLWLGNLHCLNGLILFFIHWEVFLLLASYKMICGYGKLPKLCKCICASFLVILIYLIHFRSCSSSWSSLDPLSGKMTGSQAVPIVVLPDWSRVWTNINLRNTGAPWLTGCLFLPSVVFVPGLSPIA